jgi:hypothetical protein
MWRVVPYSAPAPKIDALSHDLEEPLWEVHCILDHGGVGSYSMSRNWHVRTDLVLRLGTIS